METKVKITGNWDELKAKLKQKHPTLTDEDLKFSPGKEDELVMRLSKRLGKTEEEVSDVIDEVQSKRQGTEREGEERDRNDRNDRNDRERSESDRTDRDRLEGERKENRSENRQNEEKKKL